MTIEFAKVHYPSRARQHNQLGNILRESMTLFEVDRVFWTRQDFCLGEPLGEP